MFSQVSVGYSDAMPRIDRNGRTLGQNVSGLLSRPVRDHELAAALGIPISTYSKRKEKPDFPTFDELRRIAHSMGVDEMILHVDFGYIDVHNLNTELQARYARYREAIEVIASMRLDGHPHDGHPAMPAAAMGDELAAP